MELDRKGETLIVSGIPGEKPIMEMPIYSEEAQVLLEELAEELGVDIESARKKLGDGPIEL